LVDRHLRWVGCLGLARRPGLSGRLSCKSLQGPEPAHGLGEPFGGHVQVGAGGLHVRVAEHLLDVVDGPPGLVEPRPGLVSEIVEVQVDLPAFPPSRVPAAAPGGIRGACAERISG
jgi:hypothetical protein